MDVLFWGVFPYICITLLVGGLIWRYRSDQYGWTSESSQLREAKILRLASPLFHFGILFVLLGHFMGLFIPDWMTEAMGVSQHQYHLLATVGGTVAGIAALVGFIGLLWRRFVNHSVRFATTGRDLVAYVFLAIPLTLGAIATAANQIFGADGGYNYRKTISVWLRSLFMLQPRVDLMANVPLSFKLHIIAGLLLLAVWPFTRLVHVLSAPVGYVTRPPIVYRSRRPATAASPEQPGWTPVRATAAGGEDAGGAPAQGA